MVLSFTTATRVKARADIAGTTTDALIADIILEVSQAFEQIMKREGLIVSGRNEVYTLNRFSRVVILKGAPVSAITEIKYHTTRDFSTISGLDALSYEADMDAGHILLKFTNPHRPAYVQVIYDGGMATDTANLVALFPRLAAACDRECVERLRRRSHPSGNPSKKVGKNGSTSSGMSDWDVLPQTRDVLLAHSRNML